MAKLEISLAKDAFDALDESVKQFYTLNKDGQYELDGIGSIQRALEAEKASKKAAVDAAVEKAKAEALKPYEGVDLEAAKKAIADAQKAEDDKLTAAGDIEAIKKGYEERIAALETKHKTDLEAVQSENAATLTTLKRERLANVLTEKGVLPDRVKYLVHEMDADTELVRGENGFDVRKKGGIGDATEFEALIEGVKTNSPFFFAADNATGSGASGSDGKGGNGKVQKTRDAFSQMLPADQMAFSKDVTAGKAELVD
jgi:AMMECR1 domain-containing protein